MVGMEDCGGAECPCTEPSDAFYQQVDARAEEIVTGLLQKLVLVTLLGVGGCSALPGSGASVEYDRSCGKGHGCVFGPAWTDDVNVEGGHNGCGTRDDLLMSRLRDVKLKPGTRGCVVLAGRLQDPYSGAEVVFSKARAAEVQVDHVVPLARAWDRGAASWSLQTRMDFANDPLNLVVTTAAVNRAKSDKMPGEWSPSSPSGRCLYVDRFRRVSEKYRLNVTVPERAALGWIGWRCR